MLRNDILNAPYAYHEGVAMAAMFDTDPARLVHELVSDVTCHEMCGNYVKADVVQKLADRVQATLKA